MPRCKLIPQDLVLNYVGRLGPTLVGVGLMNFREWTTRTKLKCNSTDALERRGSVVVSTSAWHAAGRGSIPRQGTRQVIRRKNLALNIIDCLSLCLSEETPKAVGPFYPLSMPREVKDPTHTGGKSVTCRGLHILA